MMTCSATRARDQQQQAPSKRRTGRSKHEQLARNVDVEQEPTEKRDQLLFRRNNVWDRERRKLMGVVGRRKVKVGNETGRQKENVIAG